MSRFANLSTKESNDGFQIYSRRPQRYQNNQDRYVNRFSPPEKEKKIITEENFPQLSTKVPKEPIEKKVIPILNYILPIINFKENKEVVTQEKTVIINKTSEEQFTQKEAQEVFDKLVTNWKIYEDNYIHEYGEDEYLKRYGNYLLSSNYTDSEPEISDEEEIDE